MLRDTDIRKDLCPPHKDANAWLEKWGWVQGGGIKNSNVYGALTAALIS